MDNTIDDEYNSLKEDILNLKLERFTLKYKLYPGYSDEVENKILEKEKLFKYVSIVRAYNNKFTYLQ